MNRRFLVVFAGAALAVGLAALPLAAQGPGHPGGPGHEGPGWGGPGAPPFLPLLHHLELSDAQREQLHALMDEAHHTGDPGQAVRDAEMKLHAALLADTPDAQAIESLKATLNAAHAAELDRRVALLGRVAQILTAAQRQELLRLQAQGPPAGRGHGRQ